MFNKSFCFSFGVKKLGAKATMHVTAPNRYMVLAKYASWFGDNYYAKKIKEETKSYDDDWADLVAG